MVVACSSRNDDIRKVVSQNISIIDNYISDLKAARTPNEFARATHGYARQVRAFAPTMANLKKKYPDFVMTRRTPEALKSITQKYQEKMKELNRATALMAPHRDHPEVKAAQEDLIQAWIDTK